MAALQIAEHLGLPALHAEQVGGAGHVDIEEGAAHQEAGGLGGDVLCQLGQTLRGDYPGEPTLAAAAHQVGHSAERQFARFVGDFAGNGGRKDLGFVDHHQHGVPVVAVGIEQAAEEGGGAAHLLLDVEAFEAQHDRDAVLADAGGDGGEFVLRAGGIDDEVAVAVGEGDEVAFGIDDALLHPRRALFEQAAEEGGFAGAGIALDQQAGSQQFLEIKLGPCATLRHTHVDRDLHGDLLADSWDGAVSLGSSAHTRCRGCGGVVRCVGSPRLQRSRLPGNREGPDCEIGRWRPIFSPPLTGGGDPHRRRRRGGGGRLQDGVRRASTWQSSRCRCPSWSAPWRRCRRDRARRPRTCRSRRPVR